MTLLLSKASAEPTTNEGNFSITNENKAVLDYKKNVNGFDITVGSNYTLMSTIPDYGVNFSLSSKF